MELKLARTTLALTALGFAAAAHATSPPPLPLWLAGCWQGAERSAGVVESWSMPRGGVMLGLGQTVRGARSDFEFMRIWTDRDARLVLTRQPGGRPPVELRATVVEPARIAFGNPAHDAPKSVEYRRDGEQLIVLLDARRAFAFRRTNCDAVFAPR
jgi:hypothetical protein